MMAITQKGLVDDDSKDSPWTMLDSNQALLTFAQGCAFGF
jgi:hypothetical protein